MRIDFDKNTTSSVDVHLKKSRFVERGVKEGEETLCKTNAKKEEEEENEETDNRQQKLISHKENGRT